VAVAAGESADVVSANDYAFAFDLQQIFRAPTHNFIPMDGGSCLEPLYALSGRPVLISEMGWRAKDSGLPNSWPPVYPTLDTQTDRADAFEAFARGCLAARFVVGYHWFQYSDEPAEGRPDGENDNWGLVDGADQPYDAVTARTQAVNRR
jgi:agarase